MRLAPESRYLGDSPRLPIRVGRRVTQEELAEHLGISRGWYARFEAGARVRLSTPLLAHLGDTLMLSAAERAELVRLALPELAPVVRWDSTDLYEALGIVRRAVKRLWNASSEAEIVYVAGEEARQLLPCFELIFARRIVAIEEAQFLQRRGNATARYAQARTYALSQLTPWQFSRVDAVWQPTAAGALLTSASYPRESRRRYCLALREHGIDWDAPLAAHIRGSSGSAVVGGTSTRPHDVTQLDRIMLSAIADFASLALQ